MTRRHFLSLAALAPFPGAPYREYARCLPDYLSHLAREAYERRNAELAKLTTPEAIRKRQQWARETFWRLAGGRPPVTPLNARTLGSFTRPGYRVEKVLYESRPRFHVPANLYILVVRVSTLAGAAGGAPAVAVVANSWWTAQRALDRLRIEWDEGPNADRSSDHLLARMRGAL